VSLGSLNEIVVVGGGLAAVAAVETLRHEGFDGAIRLVSDERELPYDRPPLSKSLLRGDVKFSDILLHDEAWYRDQRVDLELGSRMVALDTKGGAVSTQAGKRFRYDKLLVAIGGRARTWDAVPASGTATARYLRSRGDAEHIKESVRKGSRVVLLGGGVIGLETAATLSQAGCEVTVLEATDRIMARFFPSPLSAVLREIHTSRGAVVRTGAVVRGCRSTEFGWTIQLDGDETLTADFLVIGIGMVPNSELIADAGLPLRLQGVEVDAFGQTAAAGVYAVGDVATFPTSSGTWARWENWTHARLHAAVAARHMIGIENSGYAEIPWVWSDQYEFNIQVNGSPAADDVVVRGNMDQGRLTAFHFRGDRLVGATTINDAKHKSAIRRLIQHAPWVSRGQLADKSVDLKQLAIELSRDAAPTGPPS
jgi:NADPH-dependent 2,4-dienoyl-CoA reductase/sulfur reductase-like enzyme